MNYQIGLKIVGVAVVTYVAYHYLAIYGLLLGCGMAMVLLP